MKTMKLFTKMFILLASMMVGCGGQFVTSNHNQLEYGIIRVQMSRNGWDHYHRQLAMEAMRELNKLGPTFELVETNGDIEVLDVDLSGTQVITQYNESTRRIKIDPVRVGGSLMFQAILIHQIGHFLGMRHVCRYTNETSTCSPVGLGVAAMNPQLTYDSQNIQSGEMTIEVPNFQIQPLDIQEFKRIRKPLRVYNRHFVVSNTFIDTATVITTCFEL